MVARNTNDEIQCLLETDANMVQYIDMASHIVDAYLGSANLTSDILKDIEANLAAHYYRSVNPEIIEEKYDKSTEKRHVPTSNMNMGLGATRWGQMAVILDSSGTLKNLHKRKAAVVVV